MSEIDSNIDELIEKYEWMIRPCPLYKEEYKDCTSIKSRFHQQFVHSSFDDCSQWNRDYSNCVKWTEDKDKKGFKELLESEQQRRRDRLKAHYSNDVWEKREAKPPPGWNDPLPEWIEERAKTSYLAIKAANIKEGKVEKDGTFCVIS